MSKESRIAIRLTNVSKNYMIYTLPRYWLADFLGFGRFLKEGRHYRSFWALRDINLKIPAGARVAFVGRNGAGKSTLLRIISNNIAPTAGTVEINGHCETLLELGTGFHLESTGRENIYASLAYKGITGKAANEKFWQVVDFSELEEFIDQPVKTYSSGMYLRLAFSAATVIAPEILIIDEILSAGDMYFQSKCLARMQELISGPGITLFFVSHDLNAAQRLCDTFVWIDQGRIVKVGPSTDVRGAYEDSIRKQQQIRMRARNLRLRQETLSALQTTREDGVHLLGRFVLEPDSSEAVGPNIESIRLFIRGGLAEEIRVGDAMDDNAGRHSSFVISAPAESTWSSPQREGGRMNRSVRSSGNGVDGAKLALFLAHDDYQGDDFRLELEVIYQDRSPLPCHLELSAGIAGMKRILSLEHTADSAWKTVRAEVPKWVYTPPGTEGTVSSIQKQKGEAERIQTEVVERIEQDETASKNGRVHRGQRYGTGRVLIDRVQFFDEHGEESYVFQHGHPMSIVLTYHAEDPSVVGTTMVWAASFQRTDGIDTTAMISSAQNCVFTIHSEGQISMRLDSLLLCDGAYRFSTALFSKIDLQGYNAHFTVSHFIYDMHARLHEIVVEGTHKAECWIFRHPVRWGVLT